MGIELVEDKNTQEPCKPEKIARIIAICKQNGGVIGKNGDTVAGYNNVLTLSPPLSISDDDLNYLIKVLKDAILNI